MFKLFNNFYGVNLKVGDRDINLLEKNVLSEGVTRLCQIKFNNVDKVWLEANNIYRIDNFPTCSLDKSKILCLHNNNVKAQSKISKFS